MSTLETGDSTPRKPLRLWPGVVAVVLQWLFWVGVPLVMRDGILYVIGGALACALAIIIWWLFFSRAPWAERLGALVAAVGAAFVTRLIVHPSISNAGMGRLIIILSIPVLCLALVVWAVATRRSSDRVRRAWMVPVLFLGCATLALIRTGGVSGSGGSDLHWRWSKTPEEKLLAQASDEPKALPPDVSAPTAPKELPPATESEKAVGASNAPKPPGEKPAAVPAAPAETRTATPAPVSPMPPAEWPGFRGPDRNGAVRGVRVAADWSASPPVQLWRRAVGPGWSSFAVQGDLFYTQEQRGDDESVACYRVSTGEPVWRHRDKARFWESNGGAGPRATPTLSNGRVYAFGGTGLLNALDARTGALLWSRNVASDADKKVPMWGFASSPLVIDDLVVVAAAGKLAAFDLATGKPRWFGPNGGAGYSSPQLVTIGGVPQIVLLSGTGVTSVAPADGTVLWQHAWEGSAIVQPAVTADGDILINTISMTGGLGIRRLAVTHGSGGWTVEERWTSTGLKPYFNDFVLHKGYAYGFDGNILSCIDLSDGARKWKGGRYGNGQLVLLADEDLLLVLSEEGELALVKATPDQFTEVARFKAIEGKTWNHPVLVHDILLVRNGEEMAAFRLSLQGS
jgi:outer membrane protein assembly factor BamB